MKVIDNNEHREAEAIKSTIASLCKHYEFVEAKIAFGDANGTLIFVLEGMTATSTEPHPVLGIIKNKV